MNHRLVMIHKISDVGCVFPPGNSVGEDDARSRVIMYVGVDASSTSVVWTELSNER